MPDTTLDAVAGVLRTQPGWQGREDARELAERVIAAMEANPPEWVRRLLSEWCGCQDIDAHNNDCPQLLVPESTRKAVLG